MNEQKRIWLVDDDPIAVTIMRHVIRKDPYFDLTAEFDGAEMMIEALLSGGIEPPHLIVLDLNMPMMSGWELLDFLTKRFEKEAIPVAVFTSSIDARDAARSSDYPNVIGHFVKPISMALLKQLRTHLERHYQQRT